MAFYLVKGLKELKGILAWQVVVLSLKNSQPECTR
jgi:hypothetical protein